MLNSAESIDKESIGFELDVIEAFLNDLKANKDGVSYADTADSMQSIDGLLEGNGEYANLENLRREASGLMLNGDVESKTEGCQKLFQWIEAVKKIIE